MKGRWRTARRSAGCGRGQNRTHRRFLCGGRCRFRGKDRGSGHGTPPAYGEKQQVLAKALSVSVSTVRSWEHDKSSPDHSTLVAICRRYHTSSDFLLGLSDYDPSDKARLQRQRLTEEEQNEMHRYEEYLLWKRKK